MFSYTLQDGGVFTFGWGNFGQLGHNSNSDECNPKKVLELFTENIFLKR